MTDMQSAAPSLPAFLSDDGRQYLVWCDYCFYFHRHGASCDGHRTAHCADRSGPYSSSGYRLVHHGDFDSLHKILTAGGFNEGQIKRAMMWRSTDAPKSKLRCAVNNYLADHYRGSVTL